MLTWLLCKYVVLSYVLDQILSGAPLDEVMEQVQGYLRELAEEIRSAVVPMEEYVITKVMGYQTLEICDVLASASEEP